MIVRLATLPKAKKSFPRMPMRMTRGGWLSWDMLTSGSYRKTVFATAPPNDGRKSQDFFNVTGLRHNTRLSFIIRLFR